MAVEPSLGVNWFQTWIATQKAVMESWKGDPAVSVPPGLAEILRSAFTNGQSAALEGAGDPLESMWKIFGFAPPFALPVADQGPAIGPLREVQETVAGFAAAMAEYQRLTAELSALMVKIHMDTLDLLARRASEQANSGSPIESFKALYDLWIECGEVTYAKVVQGDAYCRLQSDLGNAGIRARGLGQRLVERWLKQLDLPTRSELNTLHKQIRDLRQELAALRTEKSPPARTPTQRPPAGRTPRRTARAAAMPDKGT